MTVQLVSDQKITETSSKGNQEKWQDGGIWYKLDQFGYDLPPNCWNAAISKQTFPSPLCATAWNVFWSMDGSEPDAAVRAF